MTGPLLIARVYVSVAYVVYCEHTSCCELCCDNLLLIRIPSEHVRSFIGKLTQDVRGMAPLRDLVSVTLSGLLLGSGATAQVRAVYRACVVPCVCALFMRLCLWRCSCYAAFRHLVMSLCSLMRCSHLGVCIQSPSGSHVQHLCGHIAWCVPTSVPVVVAG